MENGRCKDHGGKSLKGPASPRCANGTRSKFQIAPHLIDRVKCYLEDPDLHHHRESACNLAASFASYVSRPQPITGGVHKTITGGGLRAQEYSSACIFMHHHNM